MDPYILLHILRGRGQGAGAEGGANGASDEKLQEMSEEIIIGQSETIAKGLN